DRGPQGGYSSNVYNFPFWQYIDEIYYYMHNLTAVPPVVWTNAAHRNGVPMYAAVTADFTGGGDEFNKLFQDPVKAAQQLFNIANTYRFDGWMFDVENGAIRGPNLLKAMQLLRAQRLSWNNQLVGVGYYEAQVLSIDKDTLPFFQAGSFFQSDYTSWTGTSAPKDTYEFLGQNGLAGARYGTYWSVYTNDYSRENPVTGALFNGARYLDVRGLFSQLAKAKMPSPSTDYYQSISIFAPDWTMYGGIHESKVPMPDRAAFQRIERLFWTGKAVGPDGKPVISNPCVADFIPPRTTLMAPPFVTRFNTGQGWCFVVNGERWAISDWNYLSTQDLLPTSLAPAGAPPPPVVADYSYDDPYDGGSALSFVGTVPIQGCDFPLYVAKMSLPAGYQAQFTYKARSPSSPTRLPHLRIVYSNQTSVTVQPTTGTDWTRVSQPLPPTPANVYITEIHIGFSTVGFASAIDALVGEIAIVPTNSTPPPQMPPITPTDGVLTWVPPPAVQVWYYNVYGRTIDGPALMGRTVVPSYDLSQALFPNLQVGNQYEIQTVNTMGQASPRPR
ncbi:MAG TPA: hypothetical protein VM165_25520, partial [Planctomycetaceae bacterium]|nr:hypothetical protein [Planctomycetaceae bacterium]